jgi:hypothetical protein
MRFAFFSVKGEALPLAAKLYQDGHDVTFILARPNNVKVEFGSGFVTKTILCDPDLGSSKSVVNLISSLALRTDLILFDGRTYPGLALGAAADDLREGGYLILNAGRFHDAIQGNKVFGQGIARACGVQNPEFLIGGLFNGDDWVFKAFYSSIQEDKLMAGRVGPSVDLMGEVAWFWRHARPKIVKETLYKLTSVLRKAKFVGFVNITREGISLQPNLAIIELIKDLANTLYGVARGTLQKIDVSYDFSGTASISLPPYPYGHPQFGTKVLVGCPSSFRPLDLSQNGEGLVTVGQLGRLGYVTATHQDLSRLEEDLLRRISEVEAPNLQYRIDVVACRARRHIPVILREVVK